MTFSKLLELVGSSGVRLCSDSRRVRKGDCFVAIAGTRVDGHDYIAQAIDNGADYIVCERPSGHDGAEIIKVGSSGRALGLLAQAYFDNPSARLCNLAVTGTNGKTTVSYLVRSVIQTAGHKCGLVGTIVYDSGTGAKNATLTTPDALEIAKIAHEMAQGGAGFMVIEASSHALSQHRLAGIDFTAAAFTNLTGDHLDYHKTAEDYLMAKMQLFKQLNHNATAVLNSQSAASHRIAKKSNAKKLWYAVDAKADITAHIESMDISKMVYTMTFDGHSRRVQTALVGTHNVSNHLAAAGLCIAAGFDLDTIAAGLSAMGSVPGRLEAVECGQDFAVLIDYAHTDDALKNVLSALKPMCRGKLIVVFGCGGDRDRSKRPRMAKAARQLADCVIVTSDNPRTEKPEDIIGDIMAGFDGPDSQMVSVEADRKKAIGLAIKTAEKNDIVLIAGKGHESYQIIGDKKIDFSDAAIAREFLRTGK